MVGEQQMSGFVGMQNPKTDNEVLRGITMVIECLKIFNKQPVGKQLGVPPPIKMLSIS